jgi:undecaprenyl-diphosphatase
MALIARQAFQTIHVPAVNLPRPGLRGVGIGATAGFGLLLADAMINDQTRFDVESMKAIQSVNFPGIETAISFLEVLTDSGGAVALWAAAMVLLVSLRWWLPAAAMSLLPVGGVINYVVGEMLVARSRPHLAELERVSLNPEERSFPSGHVQGAVMLWGLAFLIAGRIAFAPLRYAVRGLSVTILATIGFARVWDGAHWPTDVLAAYALGAMMIVPIAALYRKLDALDLAEGRLPLIKAAYMPHDESVPHAHALTSLVRFNGATVSKVYAPGILPRAIYFAAFQAPFPYMNNTLALRAAIARRNLAGLLTEYWYGANHVAKAVGIETVEGRTALVGEFVTGHEPTDKVAAKAWLRDLRDRFDAAGLPTWQIDPRQPRAVDNILETADGRYMVVDLESGLVSPLASKRTWGRAIARSKVPFFDEVFYDVTRAYVAQEEAAMRAKMGDARFEELVATLDEAEAETADWQKSEPRIWSKLAKAVTVTVQVKKWPARTRTLLQGSQEKGTAWTEGAVTIWEREGRITADEAVVLRGQIAEPTFQAMLPYLGAHFLISIPLRFPLGSIVRPIMVAGALGVAAARFFRGQIDRETFKVQASIHSPLVMILAGVPGFGSFAYLAAKPVRANRLLLRAVTDSALQKAPKNLYERSGIRRFIARPVGSAAPVAPVAGTEITVVDVPAAMPALPVAAPAQPRTSRTPVAPAVPAFASALASWSNDAPAPAMAASASSATPAGVDCTPVYSATSWYMKREQSRPADRLKLQTGLAGLTAMVGLTDAASWANAWSLTPSGPTTIRADPTEEQPAPFAA